MVFFNSLPIRPKGTKNPQRKTGSKFIFLNLTTAKIRQSSYYLKQIRIFVTGMEHLKTFFKKNETLFFTYFLMLLPAIYFIIKFGDELFTLAINELHNP